MKGKFKQKLEELFQEPEEQEIGTVRWGPLVLWCMAAGVVGGVVPFIFPGGQPFLKASMASTLFLALTAKSASRWIID